MMFFDCFVKNRVLLMIRKSTINFVKKIAKKNDQEEIFKILKTNKPTIPKFIKKTEIPTNFPNQFLYAVVFEAQRKRCSIS